MRKLFKYIESGILAILVIITISMVIPFSDMFNFSEMTQQAKNEGIFYEVELDEQSYFNRSLEIDGVIYDHENNEAYILLTSRNLFYNSLPNWPMLTVKTTQGVTDTLTTAGGGGTSNALRTRGYYHFSNLPDDIEKMILSKEQYGHSFSFTIDVSRGDQDYE